MGCFMQPIFVFYSNTEAKGRRPFGSGHLNDVRPLVLCEGFGNDRDVTDLRSSVIAAPRSCYSLQSARSYANICVPNVCIAKSCAQGKRARQPAR